jgi:choline dehydrogenase-like flavoprotein
VTNANEMMQVLLDQVASGQLSRRRFLTVAGAAGLAAPIVRAIEAARELGSKTAFDSIREAEVIPGSKATSRPDLIAFARTASASFGHAVGTAKIGTGADAVVDSELRVRGLLGLPAPPN